MEAICLFLGCGKVAPSIREDGRALVVVQITNKDALHDVIVPHLKEGGIEVILQIRELQRHTRAFVHPSVKDKMIHLRPDLGDRL
jgi:hypothetical protein